MSQYEKDQILKTYEVGRKKEKNLSFYNLIVVFLAMGVAFLLTIPAIHIRNEIYYISRDISELRTKHDVLSEENKELQSKIEKIKYKYEIIDQVDANKKN